MLPTVRIIRTYSLNNFLMPCTTELSIVIVKVKVAQSCPTLRKPMDYRVYGILQARILDWVAFPFSRVSSKPRD